ncbi:MAG: threonine--tRNA ligase [Acidimicrobiia bacterium]|nr:threonine--tRNA ligase [Acidimicrobiia bacterium]
MAEITITLPDGSARTLHAGATGTDLAMAIGSRLAKAAVIVEVDGTEADLALPLHDGATVKVVTADSERGLYTIRHSTAHVMAQAVLDLWPGAAFAIGPPVENGFYYDFELPGGGTFSAEDLPRIEARMREIIAEGQPFVRREVSVAEGLEIFADQPYKSEIIAGTVEDPTSVTEKGVVRLYANPPKERSESPERRRAGKRPFTDLCRGPHVPATDRFLGHFRLMRVAGAYWRGDVDQPMLQRVYGTAWATKKELDAHLHQLEEAEKRDHRRLAVELDLVSWPPELGPGLAVWHPKGATVRRVMEDYSRARHATGGYEFAYSPNIARSTLWETSGHLDFYADSMYPPMELDGGTRYYPKPMNCPFHMLIFRSQQRSYRELPLRLFELGMVYRYELSGVIHGLLRSRGFTQDDAHIFCTNDQIVDEVASLLNFVIDILRKFGFEEFEANLSTRPEEKSIGTDDDWASATEALRLALVREHVPYAVDEGGGAFYGPKIDVKVKDAIGRAWQLSTIQCDFQNSRLFGLEYVGPDGRRHQPAVIHRALFGSVERFFGVLLEHYAGAFPTWLAPVQARVLPVQDLQDGYAADVVAQLRQAGVRSDLVHADEPLGGRIRRAKLEKLPYVLVVGPDDVAAGTVGVNPRGGEVERGVPVETFVARLGAEVAPYMVSGA